MSINSQSPEELALSRAKIELMRLSDTAFFTHVVFSLKHRFDPTVPTARTDGREIIYGTKFFMGLTREEQIFLILHETMHCVLLHMDRAKLFDKRKYNIAADHCINLMLIDRGFVMPSCGLADPQYKGLSTEDIYKILPENPPMSKNGSGGIGEDLIEPGNSEESETLNKDIENTLIQAAIQSKLAGDKPGTIPGDIQIILDKLLQPKLSWKRLLARFLNTFNKNDYTYRRPNRRFWPKDYMPTLYTESLGSLAVAVDTSGSVSDIEFKQFITEIHSILRMMTPPYIDIIQFDSRIKSIDRVRTVNELLKVKFSGRGGTRITEVVEWANKNQPQVILFFTDGEFSFPSEKVQIPTVWLIHNNKKFTAPYGKVIHYEIK